MRTAKQKEMFEISDLRRGGGGILIFSCIRRLVLFLWVQNFEFQYFGGFQKTEYFWVCEDFVDIFWVITKLDYTKHFGVFSEGQGTEWRIFFGFA